MWVGGQRQEHMTNRVKRGHSTPRSIHCFQRSRSVHPWQSAISPFSSSSCHPFLPAAKPAAGLGIVLFLLLLQQLSNNEHDELKGHGNLK